VDGRRGTKERQGGLGATRASFMRRRQCRIEVGMGMLVLRVPLWAMGVGLGILLRPCRINRIRIAVFGMLELVIVLYLMIVPVSSCTKPVVLWDSVGWGSRYWFTSLSCCF